ncbi:class III lanthionine synthetase LanKC N-terminal domain-containing protein [Wenjunlia tyrosinilytica]|uniref:RamC N-terminal domain-containing protein n=1 Tax=Wenjunlia tyrosinilytica TaxID=1544741 RepID=A0A917ZZ42_9ACTN|nr:hypothetical protein [Wenjunlia tyrosinilytica]GGO99582.1 hypothetical protein GCM10012280_66370 [Wenjunlia tyrosinilytica]
MARVYRKVGVPRGDDHFRELAEALDRATAGLPGPAILSDRPHRRGSLVHYRDGAFDEVPYFGNGGAHRLRLRAPDGTLVEDPRKPWSCPPYWTRFPLPGTADPAAGEPRRRRGTFSCMTGMPFTGRSGTRRVAASVAPPTARRVRVSPVPGSAG